MKRVALYARVSTSDQTCDNQLRDLREYCRARGWDQVIEYVDDGVSGTQDRRPALDLMMAAIKSRKVDLVIVAAFDRFGRSTRHLVETLELFRHLGVEFISLREQIDTGSPIGQAIFTIIAAIAELERSLVVERVKAGLRRARADACAGPCRTPIPGQAEHPFRRKPNTDSGPVERPDGLTTGGAQPGR